jgi:translation initiation factor 2 alpha subunit (eIF-2alpha)
MHLFVRTLEKKSGTVYDIKLMYDIFIWPISTDPEYLIFALKYASKHFEKVYEGKLESIDSALMDCFKEVLTTKFKEKEVIMEAVLEITCFEQSGINIIRDGLTLGLKLSCDEFPFRIKLIKSPYYSIVLKTANQEKAIVLINETIDIVKKYLEEHGAEFKIKKQPEIVTDKEFEPEDSDDESNNSLDSSTDGQPISLTDSMLDSI